MRANVYAIYDSSHNLLHVDVKRAHQVVRPCCYEGECQCKEEGKNQESIQSSTTPVPGHHMEK